MYAAVGLSLLMLGASPKFQGYDSKQDGFHVEFPGTPKVETEKDKGTVMRTYTVDTDFAVYLILVINDSEVSPSNAAELFDGLRKSEKEDAKVVGDRKLTLGSLSGVELKTKGGKMDATVRMYVAEGRSYTIAVDIDHGHTAAEVGADKFFDSFSVGDSAPPKSAPTPTPAPAPKQSAPVADDAPAYSPDGVDVFGWEHNGARVVVIEHGVYDGRGVPWATVTVYDTKKNAPVSPPISLSYDSTDIDEAQAYKDARVKAEAERVRLKLGWLDKGKSLKTAENGAITEPDGAPIGNLEVKLRKASKKEQSRDCPEGWDPQLLTVKLAIMDGDGPITVLKEAKVPPRRACMSECTPHATYGNAKGALFVLLCKVQAFEGFELLPVLMTTGGLQYPLSPDLPPQ
jgi:hypothetical protein